MAKMKVRVNTAELKKFKESLARLNETQQRQWNEAAVKDLAARLLAKVIKRTPVGQYPKESGKKGGTLRKGWTGGEKADAKKFAESLTVAKTGDAYTIEIINPVEYAPYVEFGHRTANHSGWVEGRFMLTISEAELQADAPVFLMNKLKRFMREAFK
jgi:hypothetical protein